MYGDTPQWLMSQLFRKSSISPSTECIMAVPRITIRPFFQYSPTPARSVSGSELESSS